METPVKRRNRELFENAKERLQKARKGSLDLIYVNHAENAGADRSFFFLTGIDRGSFLYSSAIITKDGAAHLFVQELEEEEAKQTGLSYTIIRPGEDTVRKAMKANRYIGVNAARISLHEAGRLKEKRFSLVNIGPDLDEARARKSKHEIENLKKSATITAATAAKIPGMVTPGITEKELTALIDFETAKAGSERPPFDTVTAFGENSAVPHAFPTNRKLKKGDFVLCDFGSTYGKMCSDITRVFVFGQASAQQQALYRAIYNINKAAISRIHVGMNGRVLHTWADAAVKEFFQRAKAPGKMAHGLGHSIGLETHDGRRVSVVDYIIPNNFVTTIEPAGYLPGFGGVRIEDMVLVTRQGVEVLTEKAPKRDLIEIH